MVLQLFMLAKHRWPAVYLLCVRATVGGGGLQHRTCSFDPGDVHNGIGRPRSRPASVSLIQLVLYMQMILE